MQDISLFFGRFHPLVVHIPIGIILFAFALEIFSYVTKTTYKKAIVLAYVLTGISGGLAAFIGYLLSTSGGYDENTLGWHKWLGILTAVLALILAIVKSRDSLDKSLGKFSVSQLGLLLTLVIISITGHLGGNLTHGETYLTEYMPKPLKQLITGGKDEMKEVPLPAHIDSVNLYTHIIKPVLEHKCQSCHNLSKMKGDLNLSSIEGIENGGTSGHAVESGKLNKSELYKRVTLPRDSKKFMPPANKPALSNVELDLLKMWIENGAGFKKKFHELNPDEKEQYLVSVYLGISTTEKALDQLPEVTEIDEELIAQLESDGLMISFIAENSALIDVSFINISPEKASEILNKMEGLQDNIYKLNLANLNLADDDLASLNSMKNLHFLRLENNNITGRTLSDFLQLQNLSYLNLNGNPLSESAGEALEQLAFIDKIYLWQTIFDTTAINL